MKLKIERKYLTIALIVLGAVLILYGVLRSLLGPFLPKNIESGLPDAIVLAALGIFLYNRKLISDEAKAKAAKEQAEREAAASSDAEEEADAAQGRDDDAK